MEWTTITVSAIIVLIVLFPVAFIWYINVGSMFKAIKSWGKEKQFEKTPNLTCSIDADCPPGYVCFNGRCIPAS